MFFLLVISIISRNYKPENYYYFHACIDIPLALYYSKQLHFLKKLATFYMWNVNHNNDGMAM